MVKLSVERIIFTGEEIFLKIFGGTEKEARIFSLKIAGKSSLGFSVILLLSVVVNFFPKKGNGKC